MVADSTGESDLARWLEESGHRRGAASGDSPKEVLAYLEDLTGSRFRSREDVRLFLEAQSRAEAERRHAHMTGKARREAVFVLLLAMAFAQYYYLDMLLKVEALQKVIYFVPAKPLQRS